ncbi:MAG: hypothetical protein PWP43_1354 [Bacillota bacterium]|nr:hypothetical protein [Bacillota bacterium]
MTGRLAKLGIALTVVLSLLLTGPAWAAPHKAGTKHAGKAPAAAAAGAKDRTQDRVYTGEGDEVKDADRTRQQEQEADWLQERLHQQDQNEEENAQDKEQVEPQDAEQVQVNDGIQLKTQTEEQAKVQAKLQQKVKNKVKTPQGAALTQQYRHQVGSRIFVNGQLLKDALPPVVKEGTTLVPLRALAASLKAQVTYSEDTKTVTLVKDGVTIELSLTDQTVVLKDTLGQEKTVPLPVPPQLVEGYTFVPLRFIAETFAASVYYDPATGVVTIQEPDVPAPAEEPVPAAVAPAEETVPTAAEPAEEPVPAAAEPQQ